MVYRRLGRSGVKVSVIGLGTNQFGSAKVRQGEVDRIVAAALHAGVNHLDTADMYQSGASEEALGKALRGRWEQVVLATKFYMPAGDGPNDGGLSRYHAMFSCENSLRRLQTDHIDLYYVPRFDEETPLEETLAALSDLVRQGKVRYIGCSNWAGWHLARANTLAEVAREPGFVALQNHYYVLERGTEGEPIDACGHRGVGLIPFFPLAGGFLTSRSLPDPFFLTATESPGGAEGTFPLPEVQKDRFFLTVSIGYPTRDAEREVMRMQRQQEHPLKRLSAVSDTNTLRRMQENVLSVHVDESLVGYILGIIGATRRETGRDGRLLLGVSPRGSLALYKAALAALRGRDYVVPEDIQEMTLPVLLKRIIISSEHQAKGLTEDDVVNELLAAVEVPPLKDAV